jgi:rhodanese-related sulfurtransferase
MTQGHAYAGDITPQESWSLLNEEPNAVLVDVRTDSEWKWVGVPDLSGLGRQVVFAEWTHGNGQRNEGFLADLMAAGITGERPVIFLCRSGNRSIPAAEIATAAGLGPCYNMLDGFEGQLDEQGHRGATGWRAEGLPWKQS